MAAIAANGIAGTASTLRRLYFVRFGFAIVWALVMFTTASNLGPLAVTLLVLYPLFDVAAAIIDARASRTTGSPTLLYVNIAVSLLTAAGVAIACASGIPAVLRVWGAWAVVAGLVQLIVGATRRSMGGQWPVIISGARNHRLRPESSWFPVCPEWTGPRTASAWPRAAAVRTVVNGVCPGRR
ncbi:hypothetical protein [Actinomadura napierensis]|uniref:Integral membrane protein n=1 Tax=Actinomadura napierensis TaxID=267854 RepID=A0ABN3AAG8_9ACTN